MPRQQQQRDDYSVRLINTLYDQVPAFTDVFDEETFYTFVFCFVTVTLVLVFIISRFVTLKPMEW